MHVQLELDSSVEWLAPPPWTVQPPPPPRQCQQLQLWQALQKPREEQAQVPVGAAFRPLDGDVDQFCVIDVVGKFHKVSP